MPNNYERIFKKLTPCRIRSYGGIDLFFSPVNKALLMFLRNVIVTGRTQVMEDYTLDTVCQRHKIRLWNFLKNCLGGYFGLARALRLGVVLPFPFYGFCFPNLNGRAK